MSLTIKSKLVLQCLITGSVIFLESVFFYKTAQSIWLVCEFEGLCRSYCTIFKENGVILIPFSLKTAQTTWMVCEAHSLHSPDCAGHIVQYYCQCVWGHIIKLYQWTFILHLYARGSKNCAMFVHTRGKLALRTELRIELCSFFKRVWWAIEMIFKNHFSSKTFSFNFLWDIKVYERTLYLNFY